MPPELDAAAASSPATTDTVAPPLSASDRLAALSEPDLQTWRETGKLPPVDAAPPEATVTEDAPPVSTDAPPAAATDPAKPKNPKTEARFQQLLEDRAKERERADRLERELADLRRPAAQVAPATPAAPAAPAVRTLADTLKAPDVSAPALTEGEFFTKFPEAPYGDYSRYAARYEIASARAEDAQTAQQARVQQERDAKFQTYGAQIQAAVQADPQFLAKLDPGVASWVPVEALPPGTAPTVWNCAAQAIVESPHAPQLLAYLSSHPDDVQALGSSPSVAAVYRAIGRIEASFAASPPASSNTVTNAPAPPPTLGSRPGEPADAIRSALRDRDTGRYIAEMNKRDLAAHGR